MTELSLTMLLKAWGQGDESARNKAMPIIYVELQQRAKSILSGKRVATLQPTVLVHEAFIELSQQPFDVENRYRFIALASTVMRRLLVDYIREKYASKRGGGKPNLTISFADSQQHAIDYSNIMELDDLLTKLEKIDPRQARICERYYFGGLTMAELAEIENLSVSTINNELRFARAWMRKVST